ncbi:hypothetical protein PC113_g16749 [Phytophthora cactorum]|uniref:PH domain-like n=1 Tax=Phytophthora cactorum TaxID=29920 RepID=A0A8T0YGC3_9STRA|nr:hypothetical protein PC113_g16749 [Phytophthora cactorum]
MVLLFQRKDSVLSEESKRFVNSLPSTFINLFRKRRQLLPVWSSHKYCAMIKSTFLVYYRATKPEDAGVPGFWQQNTLKYLNLQNCKIKLIDDDSAGYVFCITPESGKGAIYFAADTEKDRAKFAAQAAAVQHRMPSLNEFTTHKLLGRGHYGRVILASNAADRQLRASTSKDMSECIESSFGEFSFDQARMSGNEQQCEDDNPEVELEAELDVDSVRIKI